ncbi:MAG: PDZ domain-containing protein [Lysobacterales bacterium]|nr:MAG: PDZ domain-containing protein [Xanthomonadales bacterium]
MSAAHWRRAAVTVRAAQATAASKMTSTAIFILLFFMPAVLAAEAFPQPGDNDRCVGRAAGAVVNDALVQAVKKASPAVVNIVTMKFDFDPYPQLDPRIPSEGGSSHLQSFVRDPRKTGIGSGTLIKFLGKTYVLTNHHVVYGVDRIVVRLEDKREYEAVVKGWDSKVDIAILELPTADKLPTVPLGDSDAVQVGELVLAIGSPFGLQHSVTVGIVSAVGRYGQGIEEYEDFIQTDAAINRGNSGGPLLNLNGELVGLNTAIRTTHMGGNVGIGFAIPVNMIKPVAEQLIKTGQVARGWLGASVQNVTDDLAQAFNLTERIGVVVTKVAPGTPAERGGLNQGDIITRINDMEVTSVNKLRNLIASTLPQSRVRISAIRQGRNILINLLVGQAPQTGDDFRPAPRKQKQGIGLTVQDVTKDVAAAMGLPEPGGAMVAEAEPGSPAAIARPVPLMQGDVILEVNRVPVKSANLCRDMLRKHPAGQYVLLFIYRKGSTLFTVLRMPEQH